MTVPIDLVKQISRGNAALIVGSGLSVPAGLPTWGDLMSPLADRVGYRGSDFRKAAQYFANRYGAFELKSYVSKRLWPDIPIEPTASHYMLTRLSVNAIFTTAIDNLLEDAYRENGRRVRVVVTPDRLPYWDEAAVNLVKLHGTRDQEESYVIARTDYDKLYRSDNPLLRRLDALSVNKTFVFLGFDVLDPDFEELSALVSAHSGTNQPRPYCLILSKDTYDDDKLERIQDLRQGGFHIVVLTGGKDWNSALVPWLEELIAQSGA